MSHVDPRFRGLAWVWRDACSYEDRLRTTHAIPRVWIHVCEDEARIFTETVVKGFSKLVQLVGTTSYFRNRDSSRRWP
jgi:hypothetical protein